MSRVIKFRAWDGRTGKWYASYNGPFVWALEGVWNGGEAPSETVSQLPKDVELMQFTGLLDKNGKEIYEGDIVRILYTDWLSKAPDDSRSLEQYLRDIAEVGQIEYTYDRFAVLVKGKSNSWHDTIKPGTHGYIEVIGNIYENPELINN